MNETKRAIKTILVVEDDYSIREALREALELEGYLVATAQNGQEGLERMRKIPKPCLVLLDMMMPIMDGRQFLDGMLADVVLAPIPVVIVSAALGSQSILGAAAFIKKPVDLDVLLKLVAHYTANS
jgi:CheY-like chemotaxis protein